MNVNAKRYTGVLCRVMDAALSVSGHILGACVVLVQVLNITTYLYRTPNRAPWAMLLQALLYAGIACAAASFLLFILAEFATVSKPYLDGLPKRIKIRKVRSAILAALAFAGIAVSFIMWGGTGQTFTGDPWWYALGRASFRAAVMAAIADALQKMAYERFLAISKKNMDTFDFYGRPC